MKTMRTIINIMVPAAVCLLALAGCARENVLEESEVRFTVSSDNASTRTAFSGDMATVGSQLRERVDWVEGDRITIWSDKAEKLDGSHSSVYAVTGVQATGDNDLISRASIDNANPGGGLRWKDGGETHTFFAAYGADAAISAAGNVQTVTGGAIPADQTGLMTWSGNTGTVDMDYAYMVGVLQSAYASTVVLPFRQMYTAFEFTIENSGSAAVPLSSFGLSSTSTKMAGGFTVAYASSLADLTVTPAADAVNALSLTLSSVSVPAGGSVTFTILALGLTQRNLTVSLAGESFGTRTLALKSAADTWVDFTASTKHRITITLPAILTAESGDLTWEQTAIGEPISWQGDPYVLEAHDPSILSYLGGTSTDGYVESYKLEADGVTKTPVTWQVLGYYPTEEDAVNGTNAYVNGSGNPDVTQSGWARSFAQSAPATGEVDYPVTIVYDPARYSVKQTNETRNQVNAEIASSNFGSGSGINNYLNLANPGNMTSNDIVESANSYIVNGPGYYRIPLVMGNGIKNNQLNAEPKVYTGFTAGSSSKAQLFRDYQNESVTSPLLQKSSASAGTPTSAFVVWQDATLIDVADENFTVKAYAGGKPLITSTQLPTGETVYWLNFHVSVGTQGNALLAVTDGAGIVMWSYHIWVTNYVSYKKGGSSDVTVDLKQNRASENKIDDFSYTLMPVNLGWIYGKDLRTQYEGDYMYVKVLQDGPSGKTDILKVLRNPVSILEFCDGTSPTYQWGRHVPMRIDATVYAYPDSYATDVSFTGKYPTFLAERYHNKGRTGYADSVCERWLGATLQHPEVFYGLQDDIGYGNWCRNLPMANLWSALATKIGSNYSGDSSHAGKVEFRNHEVHKTIYDPCPAGYSVPCYGASAFNPTDGIDIYTSTYSTSNNTWSSRSLADLQSVMNIAGGIDHTQMRGFFFYSVENGNATASGTNTSAKLYYPAQAYRAYTTGSFQSAFNGDGKGRGLYWTALNQSDYQSCGFDFYHTWSGSSHSFTVRNYNHFPTADGCFVRPMQNAN